MINNYRDLSIGMHKDICLIDKDETLEEIDKQVKIISLLSGKSEDELLNMPITEYSQLSAQTQFLSKQYEGEVMTAKRYNIGELVLEPVSDFTKVTTAQYIDFQTFVKQGETYIIEALSTLLVPKGKKYNQGYDIIEVQKAIRDGLSVAEAISLMAFFFASSEQLIKDSLIFCKQEAMNLKESKKKEKILKKISQMGSLIRNGDG